MLEKNSENHTEEWQNSEASILHKNVSRAAGEFIHGKIDLDDITKLKKIIKAQEKLIKATETFINSINEITKK